MNWLLLVVLGVIAGNVLWGYKKGFVRVALSLVSWVVVMIACYVVTPVMADIVLDNTPLAEIIQETVTEQLNEAVQGVVEGATDKIDADIIEEIEAKLPTQVKDAILGDKDNIGELITSTGEFEVDTTALAEGAAYLISLIIVLTVTRIALMVVEKVLGIVDKLPLIGQANTLLGIGAGALKGLVWTWVVLAVIAVLTYTGANTELMLLVNQSGVLTWLYENNPILSVLSEVL